jgi:tyrosine-protein kinase Etk/Wzc
MIGSHKFEELIGVLKQKYDVVILDSPPLFSVTDATMLATMVDATLLVSRLEYERRDILRNSVKRLHSVGANIIGVVVNDIDFKKKGYYSYSYHYGYNYDSDAYSSHSEDDA